MNYPNSLGAQAHSETSRAAAESIVNSSATLRQTIVNKLEVANKFGHTADEIGQALETPNSTIAARLRELELQDKVIKTQLKRKTSYKRDAFVYVHPDFYYETMGRATVKAEKPIDILKLEAEHARMRAALNDIWRITDSAAVTQICRKALHGDD